MDNLTGMRAFVRVVESGSFTRASELLKMPKSSLTKAIQILEADLRLKLLNRTTRQVVVTPDGAAYYERLVRLLDEFDDLNGSVASAQANPSGRLRVEMGGAIAQHIVIPTLSDFQERYPDIRIELNISDRQVDLISENVDCVIRAGALRDPSLIARRLADMAVVTCAAPAYMERHGRPADLAELEETHLAVSYMNALTGEYFPFDFTRDGTTVEVRCRSRFSVSEGAAYMSAGLAGLGVIQVPVFMVREAIATGTLVRLLEDWKVAPRPLHLVYPPNRHVSVRLRAFIDWASALFARADLGSADGACTVT
jgi:DNA-binding transcriptional LysR family regulator